MSFSQLSVHVTIDEVLDEGGVVKKAHIGLYLLFAS